MTIGSHGRTISLTWPGTLPAPTLDEDSAVYADVLPGVDLKMTATVEGYHELLVVKSPEAAANPDLDRIEFGLQSSGLTVKESADGGMAALDDNGSQVFTSPPAQMWDSRGTDTASAETAGAATPEPEGTPATAEDGPAAGGTAATVPIDVNDTTVAVEPDQGMLAETDTSAYPLYIDPDTSLNSSSPERTLLRSDGYADYAWDNTSSDGTQRGKGDGKCGTWNGYYCGPGYVQKLYFQFSPSALKGKHVVSAKFTVTSPWAFQCEDRLSDLVRTTSISSSTSWSTRPKELDWMGDRWFSAGRGSTCDPDSPPAPIEFADNSAEPDENLTPTLQDFAAGKFSKLTLELRAHDEGDTSAWKRFKNDATLSVNYVGVPVPPTEHGIREGAGASCETDAADPDVIADPTPDLTARVHVAAGGSDAYHQAKLRADFQVQRQYSDGTWGVFEEPVRPAAGDGFLTNNTVGTWTSPGTLSEGVLYRLAVFTWSYEDDQATHLESHSTVTTTGWCYFRVDTTAPKPPKVTFGSPYMECLPNDCLSAGGPGQAGSFTFAPATGDSNIVGYRYTLSGNEPVNVGGSTITLSITPQASGTQLLEVQAKDDAGSGRLGAKTIVSFKVGDIDPPVGLWHFDDTASGGTSATAADTGTGPGSRHPATLYNSGAGWSILGRRGVTNGVNDRSLWLNDTTNASQQTGYAAASDPVVNTEASFTVSAWAYLTDASQYRTVLSQTNSDSSGFTLRYSAGLQRWVFLWSWNSGGTRQSLGANSTDPVTLKAWTHLAATYNASAHTISLYANGKLQGTEVALPAGAVAHVGETGGELQIGRASYTPGTYTDYWRGRVDEVSAWQEWLPSDEVAKVARLLDASGNAQAENVVNWDPNGASGTTLNDTSDYGRTLTLASGAQLDGSAITLDGVDDAATTPGPALDETGSFTVTTRVEPTSSVLVGKPDGYTAQVVGQRSASGSSWGIWYQKTGQATVYDDINHVEVTVPIGKWLFGRLNTDSTFTGAATEAQANPDGVTRVTGVFDAQSGTATLYLGANQQDMQQYTAVVGTDVLGVGKAYVNNAWGHYLPGRIEEIRIWAGGMVSAYQVADVIGD